MSGGDGGRGEERERASAKSGQSVSRRHDERQNGNAPFLFSTIAFFHEISFDRIISGLFQLNFLRDFNSPV